MIEIPCWFHPILCARVSAVSQITTHVLDTARGRPAKGVPILLEGAAGKSSWKELSRGVTDADGRVAGLLGKDLVLAPGTYRMTFDTGAYFRANKTKGFYPVVMVVFTLETGHYHIPLLLSPFGYSTYRGS